MDTNERIEEALCLVEEAEKLATGEPVAEDFDPTKKFSDYKLVMETPKIRVWQDNTGLAIEEMPGKPLKRRVRYTLYDFRLARRQSSIGSHFIVHNLLLDAKLSRSMNYDQATKAIKKAIQIAVDKSVAVIPDIRKWNLGDPWEQERSYLKVTPTDTTPIQVQTKNHRGTSSWTTFTFYSNSSDFQQADPHFTGYQQSSAAAARKLYKLLKANPAALNNVGKLSEWLDKNKIRYKHIASSWR
jgi:hypothetical protein